MTVTNVEFISDALGTLGSQTEQTVRVSLSHELIGLLSEQMYGSPLKAIEELVVNAYDADAKICKISVPTADKPNLFVTVFDNGVGMDHAGLTDLWNIGRSKKREVQIEQLRERKQIGKFGIGKLAAYALATKITYLTKNNSVILAVTVDFEKFESSPSGQTSEELLPVYEVSDPLGTFSDPRLQTVMAALGLDSKYLGGEHTWTLVILENIKPATNIRLDRLRWVLETAMPLKVDFQLQLNHAPITSSKENLETVVELDVSDLPAHRIEGLRQSTGEDWKVEDSGLVSSSFPSGIYGTAIVTERTLRAGKSDDIMRSHGFFVKVRDRLVNEKDARFGLHELSYEVFNRFRADLSMDDLDTTITAPREWVGDSELRDIGKAVLNEVFNEARTLYTAAKAKQLLPRPKEHNTDYVPQTLLEYPVADVLTFVDIAEGTEADGSWFYLHDVSEEDIQETIKDLYAGVRKSKYQYEYVRSGRSARLVKFSPRSGQFLINEDHEVVRAYRSAGQNTDLLEDIATAEAVLEIYLRAADIRPKIAGEILEKRDGLLRSLARDHLSSVESISQSLLDASNQHHELEVAVVAAARAIGFVATHVGGPKAPDGIAVLPDYPDGMKKIILEAKSSSSIPDLGTIDIATLARHMNQEQALGCLLVAPGFPGSSDDDQSAISEMAREHRISCWTVKQLSDVVAATQARHISAHNVFDVVVNAFSPADVTDAIEKILGEPPWAAESLYDTIITILENLAGRNLGVRPSVEMVLGHLVTGDDYDTINHETVEQALRAIAAASKGAMTLRGSYVVILTSIHELRRRTSGITGNRGTPRRNGAFRYPDAQ